MFSLNTELRISGPYYQEVFGSELLKKLVFPN